MVAIQNSVREQEHSFCDPVKGQLHIDSTSSILFQPQSSFFNK